MTAIDMLRLLGVDVFMPVGNGGGDFINSVSGDGYGFGFGYGYGFGSGYYYGNNNDNGYDSDYYYGKNTVWLVRNNR